MRHYTSLLLGFRLFNMSLLEIKVWICRWRHHGGTHQADGRPLGTDFKVTIRFNV